MMIEFKTSGSFSHLEAFLAKMRAGKLYAELEKYAAEGRDALAAATPEYTGLASESWSYEIQTSSKECTIYWLNYDVENGFPVAVMLQYGHATGTGGYVQGRDYINPALKPVFDQIAESVWKVVTSA